MKKYILFWRNRIGNNIAKSAGFCFGVDNAVKKVYEMLKTNNKQIYTFGPIIHNEQVVNYLREKG